MQVTFTLNGQQVVLETPANRTLVDVLRDTLGITGTKVNCRLGECGVCTVLLDGENVLACLTLIPHVQGRHVLTVEGLEQDGKLDPIQQAFIDHDAFQCGYCTPGMMMSVKALLAANPNPTEQEIRRGLCGNLCRCTGYHQIFEAVRTLGSQAGTASKPDQAT